MACSVTAHGTTVNCACDGCGISYNYSTGKYHVLCCGEIFVFSSKFEVPPTEPTHPGHIVVDVSGATLLDAMKLVEQSDPGKIKVGGTFGDLLTKRVKFSGHAPVEEVAHKLGASAVR